MYFVNKGQRREIKVGGVSMGNGFETLELSAKDLRDLLAMKPEHLHEYLGVSILTRALPDNPNYKK